ncbi:beta-N-acetylhexosaminidase [Paenibacillus sp. MMS20-IR301]|uniref:beta-N-acetylhexosaminidase n=1 Tax=Paenibacillus sp. MMS20-IR301 TaxID=2895946 RepID=UPI0028E1EDB9|nr:beta-N-acetylhexosaminidase [Paenibacillus sp. MMS20-IR301]WNS45442.1 beta-N-acetylhexosaminidase [Paenibacillus sp. MMS20-IR301]
MKWFHPPALAAAACLLLISGCAGNGSSAPSGSASNPASPAAVATTAPAITESPAASAQQTPSQPSATPSPGNHPAEADTSISKILAEMTLEEKIGQMLLVGIDGTTLDTAAAKMITEDKVGGIILYSDNVGNLKQLVSLTNALKQSNRGNPAPLFMSVDQEGGKVSRLPDAYAVFPSNAAVGTGNSAEAAGKMGGLLARAVKSSGFNMNFAPVLDINSNPDNPVIGARSFGSSAELAIKLGVAEMKGLEREGAIPVVKHYPGHGDTSVDSHLELPVVNKTAAQLAKLEWLPFQAAIREQADAVMVAHILYPALDPDKPASLSKVIIGQQLRGEHGFKGVVITDDLTMGAIVKNYSLTAAAVDTVLAGSDILLIAHEYKNEKAVRGALITAVKDGTISESRIDDSVTRILTLKAKYKLTDQPVAVPDLSGLNADIKAWRKPFQK